MGTEKPDVTQQIAAEARKAIRKHFDTDEHTEDDDPVLLIVKSAIEKAIKPWRDAIGGISPVSEKPEKRNDILAEVEAKETGESRAAHASEQWRMIKDPNDETSTAWGIEKNGKVFIRRLTERQASAIICAYIESRAAHASEPHPCSDEANAPQWPNLEQQKAAHASELPFDQSKHHPSCTPHDQDLMWVCAQCGIKVPAHASEQLYRIQKGAELSYIPDWLIPVELGTTESTESYSELLAHKITHANEPTDQIAAEAALKIQECCSSRCETVSVKTAIIKSAIEKATARYMKEMETASAVMEAQSLTIKRLESRAAHASELSHDEIWDHIHGVKPAHATEQEKWHLEYEAGLVRVQKGHTILQSFPSQYAPSLLALSNAHNATLQPAHASEPPFDQSKHHPSCTPHDQDLMWVCNQCGHKESHG